MNTTENTNEAATLELCDFASMIKLIEHPDVQRLIAQLCDGGKLRGVTNAQYSQTQDRFVLLTEGGGEMHVTMRRWLSGWIGAKVELPSAVECYALTADGTWVPIA